MSKFAARITAVLLCCLGLVGCQRSMQPTQAKTDRYSQTWMQMDTVVTLQAYCLSDEQFQVVVSEIQQEMERLQLIFDFDDEKSELSGFNTAANRSEVTVSKELADLTAWCLARQDSGGTNVAMGRLIRLWQTASQNGKPPEQQDVTEALKHSDLSSVHIEGNSLTLTDAQAALHFGAVAKGYIADRASKILDKHKITDYLLDCGSSTMICKGKPQGKNGWVIGVRNPNAMLPLAEGNREELIGTVSLSNMTLGVSGDYQRYFEYNGVYYTHIIRPDTGYPARYYRTVCVMAGDATTSDYYSTALYALPYEQSAALAKKAGVEALWVFPDGTMKHTAGFIVN